MKGEKEGGEKKGKEGRKKGKGKKGEGKKGEREKKQSSTAGLEPATFHSTANCLWLLPGGIANFNFDDLTVAALAPPINIHAQIRLHENK